MEDFAVTCQLVPGVPHLLSGSGSSSRIFGLGFLQTPARDDALALPQPSALRSPGERTFTSPVPCHARRTRPASAAARRGPIVALRFMPACSMRCWAVCCRISSMLRAA